MSSGFQREKSLSVCVTLLFLAALQHSLRISGESVYISGRPFVLRDSSEPTKTLPLSDRTENLEAIEQRLKNDILAEGVRYGCLIHSLDIRHTCFSIVQVWWSRLDAQRNR
jgi:hypothetical protein